MTPRLGPIIAAAVAFVVTLGLCAWHEGLWKRPAELPVAAARPAAQPVPAPQATLKVDAAPVQPEPSEPVPAAMPAPALTDDDPAVPADSTAPPPSELEPRERQQRDTGRGARVR